MHMLLPLAVDSYQTQSQKAEKSIFNGFFSCDFLLISSALAILTESAGAGIMSSAGTPDFDSGTTSACMVIFLLRFIFTAEILFQLPLRRECCEKIPVSETGIQIFLALSISGPIVAT